MKNNLLKNVPKPFLQSLVQDEVIPVVGAGFSKNCDGAADFEMPDWHQLGRDVAREMDDFEYTDNPLEALSAFEDRYKRTALVEQLRRICRIREIIPGKAHSLFCDCFSGLICTTNFDSLIETAFAKDHMAPLVITSGSALSISHSDGPTVIKLHGDFNNPERMVITETDYDLFVAKNPLLCTFLSNLFITKTMFLVGYSLNDCDVRQLLRIVQDRLGKLSRPVYCLQVDATADGIARYKRRGVDVINIPRRKDKSYRETIEEFFAQLKEYKNSESDKSVDSNVDELMAQLRMPNKENCLCYISCSHSRLSQLKQILDPAIRSAGAIPCWPYNITSASNAYLKLHTAISAVIRKAGIRIFDITDANRFVLAELRESIRDNASKTIILYGKESSSLVIPNDERAMRISFDCDFASVDSDCEEKYCHSQTNITDTIRKILSTSTPNSGSTEAERLLHDGHYNAAIIAAWTGLESLIRDLDCCGDDLRSSCKSPNIIDSIAARIGYDEKTTDALRDLRSLRNQAVHGALSPNRKTASTAVETYVKVMAALKKGNLL